MTATFKICIATLLLAAGFGVARFMGEPAARWYAPSASSVLPQAANSATHVELNTDSARPPVTNARLVPDYEAENPYQLTHKDKPPAPSMAQLQSDFSNWQGIVASAGPVADDRQAPIASHSENSRGAPRASLRDETPRPLMVDDRPPPVQFIPLPATNPVAAPPLVSASQGYESLSDVGTSGLERVRYVPDTTAPATINASYIPTADAAAKSVAPPTWPEPAEIKEPTTHIVIDGDSLERLAGRYLDDPRRAHEIYEANREILANPELLPIGAELSIPTSSKRSAFESALPQSSVARDSAVRSAVHSGLVRLPSVSNNTMPRAQLLRPLPAE